MQYTLLRFHDFTRATSVWANFVRICNLCKRFCSFITCIYVCVCLSHFFFLFHIGYLNFFFFCVFVCGANVLLLLWISALLLQEAKWKIHHDLIYLLDLSKTTRFCLAMFMYFCFCVCLSCFAFLSVVSLDVSLTSWIVFKYSISMDGVKKKHIK